MNKESIISALSAIILTAIIGLLLAYLSTEFFEVYGSGVFLLTPIVCGALSVLIYNRKGQKTLGGSAGVAILSGWFTLLGFLIVGFEGLICLVMVVPIMLPLFIVGGMIAYPLSRAIGRKLYGDLSIILLIAFVPMFMGFESRQEYIPEIREVNTTVIIEGKVGDVWQEVIAFSEIPEPTEGFSKLVSPTQPMPKLKAKALVRSATATSQQEPSSSPSLTGRKTNGSHSMFWSNPSQ